MLTLSRLRWGSSGDTTAHAAAKMRGAFTRSTFDAPSGKTFGPTFITALIETNMPQRGQAETGDVHHNHRTHETAGGR